jgi:hypothetical protein
MAVAVAAGTNNEARFSTRHSRIDDAPRSGNESHPIQSKETS